MSSNEFMESLPYYNDRIILLINIDESVRILGAALSVVLYIPHLLTYLIFKEWRQQEHNRVFLHFVSALIFHDWVNLTSNYDNFCLHLNIEPTMCSRISQIALIPYSTFLVCEWLFLFILCMHKLLVQVIISEDTYHSYIYVLVYVVPIFVALINYFIRFYILFIFLVITLCACSVIYCRIIISVIRARKCRNAHTRRTVKTVTRFVILYTVVSAQIVCDIILKIVKLLFLSYVTPTDIFKHLYFYYLSNCIFNSISCISTPLCIIYCIFGNPNTRKMWSEYLRRKFRQLQV